MSPRAEQELGDLVGRTDPIVATYAKDDGVHIRITAKARDGETAERIRDNRRCGGSATPGPAHLWA